MIHKTLLRKLNIDHNEPQQKSGSNSGVPKHILVLFFFIYIFDCCNLVYFVIIILISVCIVTSEKGPGMGVTAWLFALLSGQVQW